MTPFDKRRLSILAAILVALYAFAGWVEPCDGHSCANDQPTITE
jgi:hypothetical protein